MPNPADDARRKLLAQEKAEQLRVLDEFKKIQNRLAADLYDLLTQIEHERRTEGNAPPALVFRKEQTRQLFEQVSDEIADLSRRLGISTANLQRRAVDVARDQIGEYAILSADLAAFDAQATRALIGNAGDGRPLAEHFAAIRTPVRNMMFDALFYGIAAGKPNQAIAAEINQAVAFGAVRSMTIVRTETNRAYRQASREFYDQSGVVTGWRWAAALDLRTCPVCWAMDGRVFSTKDEFGSHPNCRCTMIPVFPEGNAKASTGSAKFAKLNRDQQRAVLGPARLALYENGANLGDFVETYASAFGLSRRLRNLENVSFRVRPRTPAPPASAIRTANQTPPAVTPKPASPPAATPKPAILPGSQTATREPIPTFKTPAEYSDYFEKRFPGTRFDFEGMAPGLLEPSAAELGRLLDEYPEITTRLKYAGTYRTRDKWQGLRTNGKFGSGVVAHAADSGAFVAFNPAKYANADRYKANRKYGFDVGFYVTDATHGTVTHEFGHLVESWLESIGDDSLTPFTDFDVGGVGRISTIKAAIVRRLKPKPGELSDYGRKNRFEQFAEGFSMSHNRPAGDWPPFVRVLTRLIELVRTQRIDRGQVRRFDELTDAEARAAKREVNDLYESLGLKPPFKKKEL